MKNKNLYSAAMLLLGGLVFVGCSSENTKCVDCDNENDIPVIGITIRTPASDAVIYQTSRAGTPIQEEHEWTIHSMNLYMFQKGAEETDESYTFFRAVEDIRFEGGEQYPGIGGDNGSGVYYFLEPIDQDMIGKTMKFVIVANDKVSNLTSATTLADFKKSLATAELTSDDQSSDILVGGSYGEGANQGGSGFPMVDIAEDANDNEAILLTAKGIWINAEMLRNVARIDIFNYTPNMTITDARLQNSASKSYLFPQQSSLAAPSGGSYYTLLPTTEWQQKFQTGVEYVQPSVSNPDEASSRAVNTLKHVFYMYEQLNTADRCSTVRLSYSLNQPDGSEVNKYIDIELKKDGQPISVVRNTLYTLKIGDGSEVIDQINVASVIVDDWTPGDEIESPINPE